jgi:hypothetical protein
MTQAPASIFKIPTESPQLARGALSRARKATAKPKATDTTAPRAVVSGREMGHLRIAVVSRVNWRWPLSL